MKFPLMTIVILTSLSCAAYSQTPAPANEKQPVHPGTAILDGMGIYAGNPMPKQAGVQPKTQDALAKHTSNQASK
jgi:hypothetical protein